MKISLIFVVFSENTNFISQFETHLTQKNTITYLPPPVTLELLRVRPALEPEPEGSPPDGTPADKVEVTVELFGIPLPPPPLPPLEWSGNLSRSQRTEPEKEGIFLYNSVAQCQNKILL